MIDALSEGVRLMQQRSPAALPMLFGAGLITSIGPCVAPRYVALAALAHRAPRPWVTTLIFATGVIAAYVVIGVCAGTLAELQQWATPIDLLFAGALATGGLTTLLRDDTCAHRVPARTTDLRAWGIACMGAASALVVSPCCTPVVAAIAGVAAFGGRPFESVLLLAAFAAGHVLPLAIVAKAPRSIGAAFRTNVTTHAAAVVSGTLMLALAAFYGIVA